VTPEENAQSHEQAQEEDRRARPALWGLWGTIGIVTVVGGAGLDMLWPLAKGDSVPPEVNARRAAAISGLTLIPVAVAAEEEEKQIVHDMPLPPAQKEALLATVREERTALSAPSPAPAPKPSAAPAAAPAGEEKAARPIGMTLITLWDTDAVDGDVVRVVSAGYEIDVTLAKAPLTIAVPIPPLGVVNIVGLRDGGGGITAGVAIAGRPLELPVMSVGQVLGLPVAGKF